ncbi:unnamed protein product [Closterium sp. NIES-54]
MRSGHTWIHLRPSPLLYSSQLLLYCFTFPPLCSPPFLPPQQLDCPYGGDIQVPSSLRKGEGDFNNVLIEIPRPPLPSSPPARPLPFPLPRSSTRLCLRGDIQVTADPSKHTLPSLSLLPLLLLSPNQLDCAYGGDIQVPADFFIDVLIDMPQPRGGVTLADANPDGVPAGMMLTWQQLLAAYRDNFVEASRKQRMAQEKEETRLGRAEAEWSEREGEEGVNGRGSSTFTSDQQEHFKREISQSALATEAVDGRGRVPPLQEQQRDRRDAVGDGVGDERRSLARSLVTEVQAHPLLRHTGQASHPGMLSVLSMQPGVASTPPGTAFMSPEVMSSRYEFPPTPTTPHMPPSPHSPLPHSPLPQLASLSEDFSLSHSSSAAPLSSASQPSQELDSLADLLIRMSLSTGSRHSMGGGALKGVDRHGMGPGGSRGGERHSVAGGGLKGGDRDSKAQLLLYCFTFPPLCSPPFLPPQQLDCPYGGDIQVPSSLRKGEGDFNNVLIEIPRPPLPSSPPARPLPFPLPRSSTRLCLRGDIQVTADPSKHTLPSLSLLPLLLLSPNQLDCAYGGDIQVPADFFIDVLIDMPQPRGGVTLADANPDGVPAGMMLTWQQLLAAYRDNFVEASRKQRMAQEKEETRLGRAEAEWSEREGEEGVNGRGSSTFTSDQQEHFKREISQSALATEAVDGRGRVPPLQEQQRDRRDAVGDGVGDERRSLARSLVTEVQAHPLLRHTGQASHPGMLSVLSMQPGVASTPPGTAFMSPEVMSSRYEFPPTPTTPHMPPSPHSPLPHSPLPQLASLSEDFSLSHSSSAAPLSSASQPSQELDSLADLLIRMGATGTARV